MTVVYFLALAGVLAAMPVAVAGIPWLIDTAEGLHAAWVAWRTLVRLQPAVVRMPLDIPCLQPGSLVAYDEPCPAFTAAYLTECPTYTKAGATR